MIRAGLHEGPGLWIVVEPVIDLAAVAAALNSRPRKSLRWHTPVEALNDHIHSVQEATVATTP